MKKISIKKFSIALLGLVFALVTVFACINFSRPAIAQDAVAPVAVEDVNIQMEEGASVRVANDGVYGLKFTATISEQEYLGLLANTDYSFVEFGMFIMPFDYVATYGDLTKTNLFGESAVYDWATWENDEWVYNGEKTQIIKIYAYELSKNLDGAYEITGSVSDIKEENIARNFVARAYVQAGDEVELASYYNGEQGNNVNSIAYVAQKAVETFKGNENFSAISAWLTENYINKSVKDISNTDFGYIDRSSAETSYTFKLADGVKATRITTDNYVEVPFTCENSVISVEKAVVDGGLSASALVKGENFFYIHTVDTNGEKPVYSVNKVCIVIADKVVMQSDFQERKITSTTAENAFDKYSSGYIALGEDVDLGEMSWRLFSDSGQELSGTFDGRGHKLTVDVTKHANHANLIAVSYGTVKNVFADIRGGHKSGTGTTSTAFIGVSYGHVDNVYVRYTFTKDYTTSGKSNTGCIVGEFRKNSSIPTISNCMAEIIVTDVTKTQYIGTIVGCDYTSDGKVENCYGFTNGLELQHTGKGNKICYNATATKKDFATCENFDNYNAFEASGITLTAENGWSKFWTLDTENNVIKMGNNVVLSAPVA